MSRILMKVALPLALYAVVISVALAGSHARDDARLSALKKHKGAGSTVVIMDTPILYEHPEYANRFGYCRDSRKAEDENGHAPTGAACRILWAQDFATRWGKCPDGLRSPSGHCYQRYDPRTDVLGTGERPNGAWKHGSNGALRVLDLAPEANIISLGNVADWGPANENVSLDALSWLLRDDLPGFAGQTPIERFNIVALNIGRVWNFKTQPVPYRKSCNAEEAEDPGVQLLQKITAAGVVITVAAGNHDPRQPMRQSENGPVVPLKEVMFRPGCLDEVVSVGASYAKAGADSGFCGPAGVGEPRRTDQVTCFSVGSRLVDLVAPAYATSSAAPQVAAAVAVLRAPAARPDVTGAEVVSMLKATADPVTDPVLEASGNGREIPRLNLERAAAELGL